VTCPYCGTELRSLHQPCPRCGRAPGSDADETVPGAADRIATYARRDSDQHPGGEFTGTTGVELGTSTDAANRAGVISDAHSYSRPQPHPGDDRHGPLMPGQNFGERYHIVRLLGLGGMGAVYQAWDTELGVVVALKVIRPEAAADPEAAQALERRFKQELLLARQVTHKNVVRIHDLGELQGIKYITMPYIEGEDLATILKRERALDVRRTMQIARSMISGLAAAHAAGVVHRDLKPANIMIDAEGNALIMDFGIARSVTRPSSAATIAGLKPISVSGGETTLGSVVGTHARPGCVGFFWFDDRE